jgi:hypothetical protein
MQRVPTIQLGKKLKTIESGLTQCDQNIEYFTQFFEKWTKCIENM